MRLSTKISASVSLFLITALLISATVTIYRSFSNLESEVRKDAEHSLAIFRAMHIQAMLNRGDTLNNNPVITAFNGTMEQLSKQSDRLSLWVAMGPEVLAYQTANKLEEMEPPQDDIDKQALESGRTVGRMTTASTYRLSAPVILGQGDGANKKCFECHGKKMGIKKGQVIGVYSVALSVQQRRDHINAIAWQSIFVAVLVSLLISIINVALLNRAVSGPITRLTEIMGRLAGGETQVEIPDLDRSDEIGDMTKTIVVFKENAIKRQEAEQSLKLAVRKAEIANRAKSELLANMSHELRTPLNAIIGFSKIMFDGTFGPVGNTKYQEYLSDINSSGQHLLELINDILNVSAIEEGKLELHEENVDLVRLIEASIRIVKPRADSGGLTISNIVDKQIPELYVDQRRVLQVLLNLLSNAVKFNQDGGTILVDAKIDKNGSLAVVISDNGIGMTEQEIEIAMTNFGQVDGGLARKKEGSGLGLPLSKGLMELHGGTLRIESEKGRGTTVSATFPASRVV